MKYNKNNFIINDKPEYFSSGEIHYFRASKSGWRKRLRLLKSSGSRTVATYIPWRIHEPQEGVFCFNCGDGITDLTDFLEAAKKEDMLVILRPGPYSYSELMADGLPDWLVENYPEILAHRKDGTAIHYTAASYLHPVFVEKTKRWYKEVCKYIRPYLKSNGGNVITVQLDNESAGIHVWRDSLDYNCDTIELGKKDGRYCKFLKKRFSSVNELNRLYGTECNSFEEFDPRQTAKDQICACRIDNDYGIFYSEMLSEYMQLLAGLAAENGIDVPFCHNSGNIGITAFFRESVKDMPLLLGCDHYWNLNPQWPQNNPTPQKFMENLFSCRMLEAMGFPAWIPEFQYGNICQWPSISAADLECSLFAHLAFGMKGHNGYVFAGGDNPSGHGWSCKVYDYSAPVSADGKKRPTYYAIKKFCSFIHNNPALLNSSSDSAINIVMDFDSWRPGYQDSCDPEHVLGRKRMRHHHTDTVFASLVSAGLMADLIAPEADFPVSKVLCAVSGGVMSRALQQKLADFVRSGGTLVLWGATPQYDENMLPCTTLADEAKLALTRLAPPAYGGIDFSGSEDAIYTGDVFIPATEVSDCRVIARDSRKGTVAAYEKEYGKGRIIVNNSLLNIWRFSHAEYIAYIFKTAGVKAAIENSNPWVTAIKRVDADGNCWMFFINASSSKQSAVCRVSHGNEIFDFGKLVLAPMQVKIFRNGEKITLRAVENRKKM